MSYSYNTSLTDDVSLVRFYIGDTDSTDIQLQNEELSALLTIEGSVFSAAVEACYQIAAKYARLVDESTMDHSKSFSQRQLHYTQLAERLQKKQSQQVTFQDASTADPIFTKDLP